MCRHLGWCVWDLGLGFFFLGMCMGGEMEEGGLFEREYAGEEVEWIDR